MKGKIRIFLVLFFVLPLITCGGADKTEIPPQEFTKDFPTPSGRAITLEDYYTMESVQSPVISPDGAYAAYEYSYIVEEENRSYRELWVTSTEGNNQARRITRPSTSSARAQWSPDGMLVYHYSGSYWIHDITIPEASPVKIQNLNEKPLFSPDNKWIAFTKETPPAAEPGKTFENDFAKHIHERFKGREYDWMYYHRDRQGYLPDPQDPHASPPSEIYIMPRNGGDIKQLTNLEMRAGNIAWNTEGTALVFTVDAHWRDEYTYEMTDLWTVTVDGNVSRLTEDGYVYRNPSYSPDGRFIAFTRSMGLNMILDKKMSRGSESDLFIMPAEGGEFINLTETWNLTPGSPVWSPDNQYIYFTTGICGDSHLFRVPVSGGEVEQITSGSRRLRSFSFGKNMNKMAFSATDPTHPGEIYTANIDGSDEMKLTSAGNKLLSEVTLSKAERLLFPSNDGTPVEGWLLYPYGYKPEDGPYPMILSIHGGPHSAYGNSFSFQFQLWAANGYFVLYTNPRGSTGYGEQFKWATWGGWGILDFEDVMAGVDYTLEHFPIDRERLGVTGGSYGGFMTNWTIGHTDRFAAAVSKSSISNWISDYGTADIARTKESEFFGTPWQKTSRDLMIKLSPITYAGNVKTPTLFIHGELDVRTPIEEAEQMYFSLKKVGTPAKFIRYPDSYHGGWTHYRNVHRYYNELKWWEKYLK